MLNYESLVSQKSKYNWITSRQKNEDWKEGGKPHERSCSSLSLTYIMEHHNLDETEMQSQRSF